MTEDADGVRWESVVVVDDDRGLPFVQERTSGVVGETVEADVARVKNIWQGLLSCKHSTATEVGAYVMLVCVHA